MELMSLMTTRIRLLLVTAALLAAPLASGQQAPAASSCTASLLTSFTPCFSFLTSSGNGSSGSAAPTRECCRSLAALMNASTGCACLVLTGAVPLPLPLGGGGVMPVNRTLAVSLPRACDSMSVPLQCRDTSSPQIPAAGPVADTPATPASSSPAATTPATPTTVVDPTAAAPVSQGQTRPTVLPSSARRTTSAHGAAAPAALALLLAVAVAAAL